MFLYINKESRLQMLQSKIMVIIYYMNIKVRFTYFSFYTQFWDTLQNLKAYGVCYCILYI